jgi:DNA-binding NarL/FixJ family response regulator
VTPIRVVLASSHVATRAGVRNALEAHALEVCAEVADGPSAVEAAHAEAADVCLLDTTLPGDPLEAAAEMTAGGRTVVVLADSPTQTEFMAAIRAGATGYLTKDMDGERLAAALIDACRGVPALPRRFIAPVVDAYRNGREPGPVLPAYVTALLSRREKEVLEGLIAGEPTGAIAARLSVSPVTVRRHISALLKKLGVASREAAVKLIASKAAAGASDAELLST